MCHAFYTWRVGAGTGGADANRGVCLPARSLTACAWSPLLVAPLSETARDALDSEHVWGYARGYSVRHAARSRAKLEHFERLTSALPLQQLNGESLPSEADVVRVHVWARVITSGYVSERFRENPLQS